MAKNKDVAKKEPKPAPAVKAEPKKAEDLKEKTALFVIPCAMSALTRPWARHLRRNFDLEPDMVDLVATKDGRTEVFEK
jgi:hypothetical protein